MHTRMDFFVRNPRGYAYDTTEHSHDMEVMDTYKQSHAPLYLGRLKMEEGSGYVAVARWIRQTYGEKSKQCQDVDGPQLNNIIRGWKDQNPYDMNPLVEETEEMAAIRKCTGKILETDDVEVL